MQINFIYFLILSVIAFACRRPATKTEDTSAIKLGPVISCGNIKVYQLLEDRNSYISIAIRTDYVKLSTNMTFDLSEKNEGLKVVFEKYNDDVSDILCNDLLLKNPERILVEQASEGYLHLTIKDDEWDKYQKGMSYQVNIKIDRLKFESTELNQIIIESARVGWMPG